MTPDPAGSRLVVFDVCDTLYDQNTTIGFIRHVQSVHPDCRIDAALKRWLNRRSIFFFFGAAAHRLLGQDIARRRIIASLAGRSREQLAAAARSYVREGLPNSANHHLHDRLQAHKSAGDRVILLSSSIDLVVSEIASQLGVEFRSSTLEFRNERCTGRLSSDLTGRKPTAIREMLVPRTSLWVYTDNRSDFELVKMADKATIVIPKGRPNKPWAGGDCEYVRL